LTPINLKRRHNMTIHLKFGAKDYSSKELVILAAFSKKEQKEAKEELIIPHWKKGYPEAFHKIISSKNFVGKAGEHFIFHLDDGQTVLALGLGEKKKYNAEVLRRKIASIYKILKSNSTDVSVDVDSFILGTHLDKTIYTITEALIMASYNYIKHKSSPTSPVLQNIYLDSKEKKKSSYEQAFENALITANSVNFGRDLVNDPPNLLNSETMAKEVEKDAKKLKHVKIKILNKAEIKKENMNLFLSVNAGSNYEPRLVHLTYTPPKSNAKTKHICLVGKGLTFDTGGYSLKQAMANMKYDMAGAATVYSAFKAAVECNSPNKITCILGMTDNAIGPTATMPDSIFKGRNGKTVEILNTDAEGRLVLADCLDYACDINPDVIIDAATLTGAVLVALGDEICGLMGNNDKLVAKLEESAKKMDEYIWRLPIIPEFHEDIKSPIADLKNIGGSRNAGSAKAAAFLENFIKNDIAWAHLDIAGVADSQSYLDYCPKKGASGLMIRTLAHYLTTNV